MPGEAKLGLVFGMTLVIVVAVVFFRKELVQATVPADVTHSQQSVVPAERPIGPSQLRPLPSRSAADDAALFSVKTPNDSTAQ